MDLHSGASLLHMDGVYIAGDVPYVNEIILIIGIDEGRHFCTINQIINLQSRH